MINKEYATWSLTLSKNLLSSFAHEECQVLKDIQYNIVYLSSSIDVLVSIISLQQVK